jgi:hypothetical protein
MTTRISCHANGIEEMGWEIGRRGNASIWAANDGTLGKERLGVTRGSVIMLEGTNQGRLTSGIASSNYMRPTQPIRKVWQKKVELSL